MKKTMKKVTSATLSALMLASLSLPLTSSVFAADTNPTGKITIYDYTGGEDLYKEAEEKGSGGGYKLDDTGKTSYKLGTEEGWAADESVNYKLYKINASTGTPEPLYDTTGTATDGMSHNSGVTTFSNLADGEYVVVPIYENANENIEGVGQFNVKLPMTNGNGKLTNDVYVYPKTVSSGLGSVTLTKLDASDDTTTLSGAEFSLWYETPNGYVSAKVTSTEAAADDSLTAGEKKLYKTTDDGTFTIDSLPYGTYYFVEETAPTYTESDVSKSYLLDQTPISFTISSDDDVDDDDTNGIQVAVDATNDKELTVKKELIQKASTDGTLTWEITADLPTKTENLLEYVITDTYKDLTGVTIASVNVGETTLTKGTDYTLDTTTTGTIVIELTEAGLKKLNGDSIVVTVTAKPAAKPTKTEDLANYKPSNSASIDYKYAYDPEGKEPEIPDIPDPDDDYPAEKGDDSEDAPFNNVDVAKILNTNDKDEPLTGGEFEIYADEKCTEKVTANGKTTFTTADEITDLAPGTYYVKQITAPTDYDLDTTIRNFTIDDDNTTSPSVTFVNTKKDTAFDLPFTGTTATIVYTLIGIVLMGGAAFFIIVLSKKKKEENNN